MSFFKGNKSTQRLPADVLLGELLVKAMIISQKQLDECIRLAGNKRLHLGQMLIMHGYITSRDLQAAVDAQTMMRDNQCDLDLAVKCLRTACKQGISFMDVLNQQRAFEEQQDADQQWTLGHLLLEADAIGQYELDAAYSKSYSTGIPMGRILVLNGSLSEGLLSKALDLLVKVRDQAATREEAVEALKVAAGYSPGSPLSQSLLLPPKGKALRLGQLMHMSGILNETDVLSAVELGLQSGVLIGQVMVEQGYASVAIVESALELQEHIRIEHIDPIRAAEVLRQVYSGNGSVSDLITSLQPVLKMEDKTKINFEKLLTLGRVVSQEQIVEAFDICRQTPEALAKILVLTGFLDGQLHDCVLRCYELLDQGRLSQDDALVALDYCLNKPAGSRPTFDEALSELGWSDTSLSQSEHAQLAHEASFDPERTGEMIAVNADTIIAAKAEPGSRTDTLPGFNLLEHFGLAANPAAAGAEASSEKPAEAAEQSFPEESGEVPSLSSTGVETSDTPVFSVAERISEEAREPAPAAGESGVQRRLANILDRLSDDEGEGGANAHEDDKSNGREPTNGHGASDADNPAAPPRPVKIAASPAAEEQPRALGPLGRVRPDREALRQQEMTIAPQRLKIDDAAALAAAAKTHEVAAEAPAPVAEKKEAVAAAMYRLAESYFDQGDLTEAQKIYEKILAIRQAELGPQHIDLVDDLNKLAEVLWTQGNFRQAEPFVRRAVTILETTQPIDALRLAEGLRILAGLYFKQGKFEPSMPLLEHAMLLKKTTLGEEHKEVGYLLREYAKLLKKMGRNDEADKYYQQSKKILGS